MICIAAFIVFALLGIFSAKYRAAAKKAWICVGRRITFRPCDTRLKDDIKNKLLGKLILTRPRLARFLDKWIEVLAFVFIVLTIWSLLVVFKSGLNLFVYGTCNPDNSQSCSLGAEACSIGTESLGIVDALKQGRPDKYVWQEITGVGEAISLIPSRVQTWNAPEYFGAQQSYYQPYDATKPTALEVIDPGCKYCAQQFKNIQQAGFADRYNVTYLAYPISDKTTANGYKFANSYLVARYLEAIKMTPLEPQPTTPADWRILARIFTENDERNYPYQTILNNMDTPQQAEARLQAWLLEFGYTETQVAQITEKANSSEVQARLTQNKQIVEDRIHTVKIPTIIYDGKRHDGVVKTEKLR